MWQTSEKLVTIFKSARRKQRIHGKCKLRNGLGHAVHGNSSVFKGMTQSKTCEVYWLFKG